MSVLMFQPQFVEPILAGIKRQTIRPRRKRPPKINEALSLRIWIGAPYRLGSKREEFAKAVCEGCFDIRITESGIRIGDSSMETRLRKLNAFAKADGFTSWQHMRDFFSGRFGGYKLPFEGTLIYFRRTQEHG